MTTRVLLGLLGSSLITRHRSDWIFLPRRTSVTVSVGTSTDSTSWESLQSVRLYELTATLNQSFPKGKPPFGSSQVKPASYQRFVD